MMKRTIVTGMALSLATLFISACNSTPDTVETAQTNPAAYKASIEEWHKERITNLKKEDGWLALAGLFWLEPGINTFGSGPDNDLVFPEGKIAAEAGAFILEGDKVKIKLNDGAEVKLDGKPVQDAVVYTAGSDDSPKLTHGSLTWFVIQRGDKYGIRLRDTESEVRKNFTGIDRYEVNPDWQLQAKLEPNTTGRKIAITNVLGQTSDEDTPGALVFKVDGKEYKLDVMKEGDELFVLFADKTNGNETYGAGRYLYTNLPDANGNVTIDFNKAYNPPCAFVTYATCPLPPKQNFLPIPVPAGEKAFEGGH